MNFKELCEALILEGEGRMNGVADFTGLPEWPKAQAWIKTAYEQIQREQPFWKFRFASGQLLQLRDGVSTYLPIVDVAEVVKDSLFIEVNGSRQRLGWIDYSCWNALSAFSAEGLPRWITQKPSEEFVLAPTPDASYVVEGEWYSTIDTFDEDEDEPIWAEEFHSLILWTALQFWAEEFDVPSLRVRISLVLPRMARAFALRYLPATKK